MTTLVLVGVVVMLCAVIAWWTATLERRRRRLAYDLGYMHGLRCADPDRSRSNDPEMLSKLRDEA